jgi:thiol-disulfide isomerase/thioredoxin
MPADGSSSSKKEECFSFGKFIATMDGAVVVRNITIVVILLVIAFAIWLIVSINRGQMDTFTGSGGAKEGYPQFIMFYTDWCGYCQQAKPEFQKLMTYKNIDGKPVSIKMINGDQIDPAVKKQYGVESYPTFMLVKSPTDTGTLYTGQRDAASFVSFLKQSL